MNFTLEYADNAELVAKLRAVAASFGYTMTKANPGRVTVGELAKLVHRPVSTVSRALSRPSCPPFVAKRGKKRILWLEPNDRLLSFLANGASEGAPRRTQEARLEGPTLSPGQRTERQAER